MNIFTKIVAHIISIPAWLKGVKFGKNSFIGPFYDFLFINLKGLVLGDNVVIGRNAWIQTMKKGNKFSSITIGNNTQIGRGVTVSSIKKIKIGKNCLFSFNVSIFDCNHNTNTVQKSPMHSGLSKPKEVIVEDECFIGAHSFILKGVHLKKHCVVGANSVVTKSFPAYSVIAGNPAKLVKKLK